MKFTVNKREYEIKLTYGLAITTLPDKFDIRLAKMFVNEEEALDCMRRLILDDELLLQLMHFFMDEDITWDRLLDAVTPDTLDDFREAFWTACAVFSGPLKKGIMEQMWRGLKKEIKTMDFESLISEDSPSPSNPEESQEQTS